MLSKLRRVVRLVLAVIVLFAWPFAAMHAERFVEEGTHEYLYLQGVVLALVWASIGIVVNLVIAGVDDA
jgi:hypothetical protein